MPGDFEFRAQSDLLASLKRDVEALKRQTAAGVMFTVEMPIVGSTGGVEVFDGPISGGLVCDVYRHNDFVHVMGAARVSATGALGGWQVHTPWPLVGNSTTALNLCGRWRGWDASTGTPSEGMLLHRPNNTDLEPYINASGSQLTATAPWTWAAGDEFYFTADLRLQSGS